MGMKNSKVVVFDLDDTLIYEIDFLKSAFREIGYKLNKKGSIQLADKMFHDYRKGENVFKQLIIQYPKFTIEELLSCYRNHIPKINLIEGAQEILDFCKKQNYIIGLISDGRSLTQRNKLKSVKIESCFDLIIISEEFGSEKPCKSNYEAFLKYNADEYYYIGDNLKKDFITPNMLGWTTICLLNNGSNIHSQEFIIDETCCPKFYIKSLAEVISIIQM